MPVPKGPKPDPNGRKFYRMAVELALSNIVIIPCADCGRPVEEGYVCHTCGSNDPGRHGVEWTP